MRAPRMIQDRADSREFNDLTDVPDAGTAARPGRRDKS